MSRNAVITGGTGALGQAVVERLLRDDVRCHVTWKFEAELESFRYADSVALHEVDSIQEGTVPPAGRQVYAAAMVSVCEQVSKR